jgi:hypothetical protein
MGTHATPLATSTTGRQFLSPISTTKRIKSNGPIDGWYPYYAGYTLGFALEVVDALCRQRPCTVLDPWNGSGTSTAAAVYRGHKAIGCDLNPATLAIASAKLVTRDEMSSLPERLRECFAEALDAELPAVAPSDPLLAWTPRGIAPFCRHLFRSLRRRSTRDGRIFVDPLWSAVTLCLLRALRGASVETRSNSAWATPVQSPRLSRRELQSQALAVADAIARDIALLPTHRADVRLGTGDARTLDLDTESVDLILTSPPYCTRIDYAQKLSFEWAALLGCDVDEFRSLRCELMGTTAIRDSQVDHLSLPDSVTDLLDRVRSHSSHRSESYYFRNLVQYFSDADLSVAEMSRVLRRDACTVLVLQNSYYKEIPIPLTDLFADIGRAHGLTASVVTRRSVSRSMSAINTRAKRYVDKRVYTEDVLLLEKSR